MTALLYVRELRVNRGFALTIGLLAALVPAMARAQTNIDQGKSASQLFGNSCAECHKAPQTLAKGKSAATVAEFLSQHYTTGRDQAAALAVYVVSGRDTVAAPAPGRRLAPGASAQKPPKPDEKATANANPRRPGEPTSGGSMMNPIVRSEPGQRDNKAAARSRRRPETQDPAAALAHAPSEATPDTPRTEPAAAQEPPTSAVTPSAAAPMPAQAPASESGEGSRDNIPD
jgi:hypothetical protein